MNEVSKRSQKQYTQCRSTGRVASKVKANLQKALALHRRGELVEAERVYRAILKVTPEHFDATHLLGVALMQRRQLVEAEQLIAKAVRLNPNDPSAFDNHGNALQELKQFDQALASHDKAIALRPDFAAAFNNRGNALHQLKRFNEALASFDKAIALKPDFAEAFYNRGNVLTELKHLVEALARYDKAIALKPDYPEALNNRGLVLEELRRLDEALASYETAIALRPDYAEAFSNRGNALRDLKRFDEALASYDKAIALKADFADGYRNRALGRLLIGRYKEGWTDYEWRWDAKDFPSRRPDINVPTWQGEDLKGRHLLVFSEQGLGDVIQFVRYLPLLAERNCKITFLAPAKLVRLLRPSIQPVDIVSAVDGLQGLDLQVALMSLPHRFNTELASIPSKVPYLRAEEELEGRWRARIGANGFKIGIAWQGNPSGSVDKGRSIPLEKFAPLGHIPGVRLISLQKHVGLDQLAGLTKDIEIESLGDAFDNGPDAFVDAAAVMNSLDLIITSDTAIAHLAGALGRPTWVALKDVPDWRWLLDREDSPWYPTVRLFRQPQRDDWSSAFANIERELRALLKRVPTQLRRRRAADAVTPTLQIHQPAPAISVNINFQNAVALYRRGELVEAERVCREILRVTPDHFDATHLLGVALMQRRQFVEAEQLIAKAVGLNPNDPSAFNNHGAILQELKRFDEALASYDKAIALKPDYAEALNNRGNVLQELKRFNEALASYDKAITLNPAFAEAFNNRGAALQDLKRFEEALASYNTAIALKPDYPEALNNRGNTLLNLKRFEEALASYDTAIALKSDYAEAFNNRGDALLNLKRFDEALASCDTAIALKPDYADAFNNRGNALLNLNRFDEGLASYDTAIALKTDYTGAFRNRGVALQNLKRFDEALASYDTAIALKPDYAEAFNNRGDALQDLGRADEALSSYDKAITLNPTFAEAFNNRGNALLNLKRFDEALASYDKAIALKPDYAEAFNNRGNTLLNLRRFEQALASYDKAIALKPDLAKAFSNRGVVLQNLERFDEALASYDKAVALKPDYAEAFNNRGNTLLNLRRFEQALASYDKAIILNADYADGYWNRASGRLLVGRFKEGWTDYEWRWEAKVAKHPEIAVPTWQGEDLVGRRLLVFSEQGLGDVIQFSRYLPLLAQRKCKVIFLTLAKLVRLLRPSIQPMEIVSALSGVQGIDLQIALMSLPHRFNTELGSIPSKVPYLKAEPELEACWRARIGSHGFRIGIAWQGNPRGNIDEARSIPLVEFAPLSRLPGVRLISLQKHVGLDQLAGLTKDIEIESLGDGFDNGPDAFVDTAAVMNSLDLIITSDTAIAHLAGALGRPTWLALKDVPDWRWLLDREDSPWYPTVRLFRQPQRHDWESVFANIKREIGAALKEKGRK